MQQKGLEETIYKVKGEWKMEYNTKSAKVRFSN